MNRLTVTIAALAATTSLALADPPPGQPSGARGGPPIERLAADLGLDETQKAQVKEIFDAMEARRQAMEADVRQQLSGVLTAEQLKKFDEMHQRRHPPGPPPGQTQGQ